MSRFFAFLILINIFGCASNPIVFDKTDSASVNLTPELSKKFKIEEPLTLPSPVVSNPPVKIPAKVKKTKSKLAQFKPPNKITSPDLITYTPIKVGEEQSFVASWSGFKAVDIELKVLGMKSINSHKVYELETKVSSFFALNLFYKINDTFSSFIDSATFYPIRFEYNVSESKKAETSLVLFDWDASQIKLFRKIKTEGGINNENKVINSPNFYQDYVSSLFYLRTIDFSINPSEPYTVYYIEPDGAQKVVKIKKLGNESYNTKNNQTLNAYQIELSVSNLDGSETKTAKILLASDHSRRILQVEAKIKVGTITIKESSYSSP
jgi:hypothetical protein